MGVLNNISLSLIVSSTSPLTTVLPFSSILTENEYEVEYALDGFEALELVKSEDFDLILMDVMMPQMDGFETCKKIKDMDEKSEIPVIFITPKNDAESIEAAYTAGGVDYVQKPFNAMELLARVKIHIELKKSREKLKMLDA